MRKSALAAGFGLLAGATTAAVLRLMVSVNDIVWPQDAPRWYIFAAIMVGGVLIALIRSRAAGIDFATQLSAAHDPLSIKKEQTLLLAVSAIIAVGFGGAVGPEAGLLAVVMGLASIVALLIGRNASEHQLIGQAGSAAALGGLYGSPPGAAVFEDDDISPLKAQLFMAAVAGLAGFMIAASWLFDGGLEKLHLPPYVPDGKGLDMVVAAIPAALGAIGGLAFVIALPVAQRLLARTGGVVIQTLIGSVCFALLATTFPILRFSGHHEFEPLLAWGTGVGFVSLFGIGMLKVLAVVICLASGWRGGAIFPLAFAGAAMGAASIALVPGMEPTVALVAGMGAATTLGMGRPIAAVLVVMVFVGPNVLGPLCVGALVGFGASRFGPPPIPH